MKKTKGFTLIECIVAMAVLAVASLVMAQIYADISMINRLNHNDNTSLAQQMKYVEQKTNSEAIGILFNNSAAKDTNTAAPHVGNRGTYIKIVSSLDNSQYSYSTDTYVLLSRDRNDANSSKPTYVGDSESNYDLRYKYIVGHKN